MIKLKKIILENLDALQDLRTSWQLPNGEFKPARHRHDFCAVDILKALGRSDANFTTANAELFKLGYIRVRNSQNVIYINNNGAQPNKKQLKALINLAIETSTDRIIHELDGKKFKILWDKTDMLEESTSSKQSLHEGMNVYVKDTDTNRFDTLYSLAWHLQGLSYRIIDSLPADQQAYFQKNRPAELLTIDGTESMDSPTGVLNLYVSGYTTQTLRKILYTVMRECKRLKIKVGKLKQEQSRMYNYQVIRIPILQNDQQSYKGPPEIHLSNRNAYHIFHEILQYDATDEYNAMFEFDAKDLKERIEAILKHDPEWIKNNIIYGYDSNMPKDEYDDVQHDNPHDKYIGSAFSGAHIISAGLDEFDIIQRLMQILEIANWAIKHNKTKLYAC